MLFLVGHATTPDKLKLITSAAGGIDTAVSYIDSSNASPPVTDAPQNEFHKISTATTTDICAGNTSASKRRNVKQVSIINTHASVANNVSVILDAIDGNDYQIVETYTLQPGEGLRYDEGIGWFKTTNLVTSSALGGATNKFTGADLSLSTTDVYLTNSALTMAALGTPTIGRVYRWYFVLSKTAGTAAPVLTVRTGTAGTTSDTSRVTFTWGVGTSATDRAEFFVECLLTAVGASAVIRPKAEFQNNLTNAATGFSGTTLIHNLQPADSGTFDCTTAGLLIGLSWNGGTAFSGAMEYLTAETLQF